MMNNINMVSLKDLMARILSHPLLLDVTLELGIRHTVDFINIVGFPQIYKHSVADVEIKDYRGVLPCDLVLLILVAGGKNNESLKLMTDVFDSKKDSVPSYRVQGNVIFTTFENGTIKVSYRAMYLDEDGFPMIPDLPLFQKALELYIKCQEFTILFDQLKISLAVLLHTEQEYSWAVGLLNSDMKMPNIAEMENIKNMLNQLIQNNNEYRSGFKHLGDHIDLPNRRF